MAHQITDNQELFVIEEICCRGDVRQTRFKVQVSLIKQAITYSLLSDDEKDEKEEEIDSFLDASNDNSISSLLASIFNQNFMDEEEIGQLMPHLEEYGRFQIEDEESVYGVGVTKELAYQAFCELESGDDWDE